MTLCRIAKLLTLTSAYILAAHAWAQPGSAVAPELAAKPLPTDVTALLDIDFRCDGIAHFETYPFCEFYKSRDIISVSAIGGTLIQNETCPENVSDQGDPGRPGYKYLDGYGIVNTRSRTCDDGIEKGESLVVSIASTGDGQAAFDVNGVWLTDFLRDKNGESGVITLTLVDDSTRDFSFNWKDVSSQHVTEPNYNNDFFVGFGETLRITSAVISGNSGSFSVAGFSQQPLVIDTQESVCDDNSCNPELARNVRLELQQASGKRGNKGVKGTLSKEGVYVIRDTRPQCQPGASAAAGSAPLPIHITNNTTPDLIMLPHQCGHPAADSPSLGPVIYVLDLDGSRLRVAEDTIKAVFEDDSNDPSVADTYFCAANDPAFRPGIGWLPKSQPATDDGGYSEIPVFAAEGHVVFDVQDNTVGPCGSSRGSFPRYSYVVYNWVNRVDAAGTSYDAIISARIDQLAAFVDGLFVCVQQGVNQSTLSSDVGRIRQSFDGGRYEQTVKVIEEMQNDVLDPRLNDEIGEGGCFFDLAGGHYVGPGVTTGDLVPANAVGNLLVQLGHLHWMVRTTVLNLAPETVPAQGN
ncbi:MAG: hypothetical protein R6W80_01530 [Haliea sp.]